MRRHRTLARHQAGPVPDRGRPAAPPSAAGDVRGAIADNAPTGIALIGAADGTIIYVNRKWNRMFGYDAGELLGLHISVVNAPAEQPPQERAQEITEALAKEGVWQGEIHNVRKDGSRFWTAASVSQFEDADLGTVWISTQSDITEQRASAAAHREAEERLRTVFDDAPVGMALVGSDLRVTDANAALCTLTGHGIGELDGKPLAEISHQEDTPLDVQLAARLFSDEIPRYRVEKRLLTKDGRWIEVAVTSSVARDPDGRPLYQIMTMEPLGRDQREPAVQAPRLVR